MSRLIDADALIADCQLAQKQANRHGREFANAFYSGGGEISTEWWCVEDMIDNAPTIEERKMEWIPCSERMPKKHGESYLVTISDGAVYTTTLQWDANGKRWYLSFFNDGNILVDFIDDVIAWLPLPEPYQAERWE